MSQKVLRGTYGWLPWDTVELLYALSFSHCFVATVLSSWNSLRRKVQVRWLHELPEFSETD